MSAAPASKTRRSVSRDDLLNAAMALVGPNRSVATLGLREIARQADIAPNSFYRHFRDTDELAVVLIERAGQALRRIIGQARQQVAQTRSITRTSVEIFMDQLDAPDQLLPLLLREGTVGSAGFKQAVDMQLQYFEDELHDDLVRLQRQLGNALHAPRLAARAITRLVFTMGATALDRPRDERETLIDQTETMVRMIIRGAQGLAADTGAQPDDRPPRKPR